MTIKPLGLPVGSVRALLLLSLAVRGVWELQESGSIADWMVAALVMAAAAYFSSRSARNATGSPAAESATRSHPLGLPAGTVRTLFLAAIGYGAYVWFKHHGSGAERAPVVWVVGAFLVGIFVRWVLTRMRLPQDHGARAFDHALAAVALVAGVALPVIAILDKGGGLPPWAEPLMASVVVHYFAVR